MRCSVATTFGTENAQWIAVCNTKIRVLATHLSSHSASIVWFSWMVLILSSQSAALN